MLFNNSCTRNGKDVIPYNCSISLGDT